MKELRFHPQYRTVVLTTSEDSFNIFRPNLDPEEEEVEEEKTQDTMTEAKESKVSKASYQLDSDEDMEQEEERIMKTAKTLNK